MIWFLLQRIGFFIFLFLTIKFVWKRQFESLLVLYFWGLVFATCYYFAITIWFPTKVIALGMIVCMLIYPKQRDCIASSKIRPFISCFLGILILSDFIGIVTPPEYATHINRGLRLFNTNYTYITSTVLLLYGSYLENGFVQRVFPKYCIAIECAIGIGLLHYLCLKAGIGFMPILRQDGSVNIEALTQFGANTVYRIYGFAGEPKSLGFLICPYLVMLLYMYFKEIYRISKRYHVLCICCAAFVLVNTYSSAVLINIILMIPVMMLFIHPKYIIKKLIIPLICGFLIIGIISVITYKPEEIGNENPNFIESIYNRSFGRAQSEMDNGRQEAVVMDYYLNKANIINVIFGWGPSQYTFQVPEMTIGASLIPLQSGLILTMADFGILGLILIIYLGFFIIRSIKRSIIDDNIYAQMFSIATLSSFIGSLTFGSIVGCFIYLLFALNANYDDDEIVEVIYAD